MKLFLIRHGESEANLQNYFAGQSDMPLTALGVQQASSVQPILKDYSFDKVYSSDLQRASRTCENALPGVAYETLKLLREYDVGTLTGEPINSDKRKPTMNGKHRPDYTMYGGENSEMVCARAKEFLQMLETKEYAYVAAFSHYGFINSILRTILGVTFESKYVHTGNCAVHVVEYDGEKWKILALNYGVKV